ncbi:MAG: ParB N-terminal domain-containing protein [Streptosporangiaceae bacterium]
MSTFGDVTHDHPDEQDLPAPGTGPEPGTAAAGEQPDAVPGGPDGEPVPGTLRAMIPVAQLAAHPGNVRRDLDLSSEFIESVRANGVLVALRITPDGDGYRVIDGGRRLAAAVKAGVDEVPYDLVSDRAGDEAGQYLDMINMNRHRNPLTALEEADALFAAKQAGAPKTRIRKATGLTSAGLSNALSAAKLSEEARARVAELDEQLTLDNLAVMAEFDGDEDALARLAIAASCGTLEHEAELLRQARAEQAEQDRLRGELEAAGYTITDILPANGQHLGVLSHDGDDLTPGTHAACPGRGVFFRFYAPLDPVHYCANPDMYGHIFRFRPAVSGAAPAPDRPSPEPGSDPDPGRRLVVQGNREWQAAATVRHRWLATHLFARRTAPREAAQFVTRQLLAMPEPLRSGLAQAHHLKSFAEITGREDSGWLEMCDSVPANRLPLVMLAPIVTAYEHAMTDGDGRNTWRTDRYSPCPRAEAASYLKFLADLGYQLAGIEQAVVSQRPYTGETPPGDPLASDPAQPTAGEEDAHGPVPCSEQDDGTTGPEDSHGPGGEMGTADEPDTDDGAGEHDGDGIEDAA